MAARQPPLLAITMGALAWTATEYGLHRFAMHELRGQGLASREHLMHHADVTYFSPMSKKLMSAAGVTGAVLPAGSALAGRRRAAPFTAGLIGMYFVYELLHRRAHTHPPRTGYGRWLRRSHFHHHFGAPMRNFGVTTSVWDRALGTYDEPGVVTVPARMAPEWMVGPDGEVRDPYAADYLVKGRAGSSPAQNEADRADAFANLAPAC